MAEQIQRADAPVELTWNLKDLFATAADFDEGIKAANAATAKLAGQAKSFTADAAHFYEVIRSYFEAQERLDRLAYMPSWRCRRTPLMRPRRSWRPLLARRKAILTLSCPGSSRQSSRCRIAR